MVLSLVFICGQDRCLLRSSKQLWQVSISGDSTLFHNSHGKKKIKEVVALSDVLQTVRMYWKRLIPYRVDWGCQDHFDGKN